MYHAPVYVWAVTLIGVTGFPAMTCLVLYRGARAAGSGRWRAALLGALAAVVLGGWFAASGLIAAAGHYHTPLGKRPPWLLIATTGALIAFLAMSRIPAVGRALSGPGSTGRNLLPHAFRVAGLAFLMMMALGRMPALFALPAGLGDIAIGIETPFVARRTAHGGGRRAAFWLHVLGIADLVTALVLGGLTASGVIKLGPPNDAISLLPMALVPTAGVPLLLALHIVSLRRLRSAPPSARTTPVPAPVTVGRPRATATPVHAAEDHRA